MNLINITLENVRLKSLTTLSVKTSLKRVTFKQCKNLNFLNDGEMVIDEIIVVDSQNCFITSNTCSFSLSNSELVSNDIKLIKKNTQQPLFYTNNNLKINLLEVKANVCISKETITIQCADPVYLSDFYYTTDNCKNDSINSVIKEKTVYDLSEFSISNINITRFNQPCIFHIKNAYNLSMFYCNNIDIICKEKCDLNDFHIKVCNNCSLVNLRPRFSCFNRYDGVPNDIIELENMIKCGIEVIKGALTTYHNFSDDVSNRKFISFDLTQLLPKIPEGIVLIDNYTFRRFSYTLTSIELPNSLTEIRKLAFRNCIFLKSMNFKNVKIIKENVFTGCSSLSSITFSDHICEIGQNCFSQCNSLKSITIPSKVVKLGKNAFGKLGIVVPFSISDQLNQTENLQEYIVLPTSIQTLEIPTTVTNLSNKQFYNCKYLTSITIPTYIKRMNNNCFYKCYSLQSIKLHSNLIIGKHCFTLLPSLNEIILPTTIQQLNNQFFMNCYSLSHYTIPSHITVLGDECFNKCTSLTEIIIPTSITSIKYGCFNNCNSIQSIIIPHSVKAIGACCFNNCYSINSIQLPSTLSILEICCFKECNQLTTITLPSTLTIIKHYCFFNCYSLETIHIPNKVQSIGRKCFSNCTNLKHITMGNELITIDDMCFSNCKSLNSVNLSSSLISIGKYCFEFASLTSITIPSTIHTLQSLSFAYCFKLTNITIPRSTIIDKDAFFSSCNISVSFI
ncbi:hypothetical protein QTN25_003132 [Entamoeba marina]